MSQQSYDIEAIRRKMKEKNNRRQSDPDEFIPPKVEDGKELIYRFYFLAPYNQGDVIANGPATRGMDGYYCIPHGCHFFNKKHYECPRLYDGSHCDSCQLGFDLMEDEKDKEKRRKIARDWLGAQQWSTNIYFPEIDPNPPELRGKVKKFIQSVAVNTLCNQCLERNETNDLINPQPYGVFYDEYNSYLFQLVIKKEGGYNNYKSSSFLTSQIGKHPIAAVEGPFGRTPNVDRIRQILSMRHDLWSKIDVPDANAIKAQVAIMSGFSTSVPVNSPVSQPQFGQPPAQYGPPLQQPAQFTQPVNYGPPLQQPVQQPPQYNQPLQQPVQQPLQQPVQQPLQYGQPLQQPVRSVDLERTAPPVQETRAVLPPGAFGVPQPPVQQVPVQQPPVQQPPVQQPPAQLPAQQAGDDDEEIAKIMNMFNNKK